MQKSDTKIISRLKEENDFLREENFKLKQKVTELLTVNNNIANLVDEVTDIIHNDDNDLGDVDISYEEIARGYQEMGDINLKLANEGFSDELH